MKTILTFLLLFHCQSLVIIQDSTDPKKDFFSSGALKSYGVTKKEKREGEWIFYEEFGAIKEIGNYKNNKRVGVWKSYHFNEPRTIGEGLYNEENNKEGEWIYKRQNGQIYKRVVYTNGKIQGDVTLYHANGAIKKPGEWGMPNLNLVNDECLEGSCKTYYKKGALKSIGNCFEGKKNGHWSYYLENGDLVTEGNYKEGVREGVWKDYQVYYRISHGIIGTGKYNVNKKREGEWIYKYENGQVFVIRNFINGKMEGKQIEYFANGKRRKSCEFIDGENAGEWLYWDNNELVIKSEFYNRGRRTSTKEFYENGQIRKEETIAGKRDAYRTIKTYYENGVLKSEENYQNGYKQGEFNEYNKEGQLISSKMYERDQLFDDYLENSIIVPADSSETYQLKLKKKE